MEQKKILIYGMNHQAEQLKYYFDREKCGIVSAFIVDHGYKRSDQLLGIPVFEFEEVEKRFPVDEYEFVISFAYKNMVRNRQQKFEACKEKGYRIFTFISKEAHVFSENIGEGSIIYPNSFVEPYSIIGEGNFIDGNTTIGHHAKINPFNCIMAGSVICGDVTIGSNCFFGVNSTVTNGVHVSDLTFVAAGAVLNRDTEKEDVCFAPRSTIVKEKSLKLSL